MFGHAQTSNKSFQSLQVVGLGSQTQLQEGEKLNKIT